MSKKSKKKQTSPAAKAANRLNAKKSTGPKTPEGKEASAQNSLKHGLTAQKPKVLSWEDPTAFETLRDGILEIYDPQTVEEASAANQVIDIQWRLNRILTLENMALEDAAQTPADIGKQLREFSRYQANLNKFLVQAYQLLNALVEGRQGNPGPSRHPMSPNTPAQQRAEYKKRMAQSREGMSRPMAPMDPLSQAKRWEEYKASLPPAERAKIKE